MTHLAVPLANDGAGPVIGTFGVASVAFSAALRPWTSGLPVKDITRERGAGGVPIVVRLADTAGGAAGGAFKASPAALVVELVRAGCD